MQSFHNYAKRTKMSKLLEKLKFLFVFWIILRKLVAFHFLESIIRSSLCHLNTNKNCLQYELCVCVCESFRKYSYFSKRRFLTASNHLYPWRLKHRYLLTVWSYFFVHTVHSSAVLFVHLHQFCWHRPRIEWAIQPAPDYLFGLRYVKVPFFWCIFLLDILFFFEMVATSSKLLPSQIVFHIYVRPMISEHLSYFFIFWIKFKILNISFLFC